MAPVAHATMRVSPVDDALCIATQLCASEITTKVGAVQLYERAIFEIQISYIRRMMQ